MDYFYDAIGTKLEKTVFGTSTGTTQYAGGYIYENGTLQFFSQPEGYVSNDNGTLTYVYEYRDHLGNTRLSYTDADNDGDIATNEIVKESNYYPFGLAHQGYKDNVSPLGNSVAKKYMFGGKEFQNELNLDWNDISARNFEPALGRWMNTDKLSELGYGYCPFAYSFNNPIYFIDSDGEWAIAFQSQGSNRRGQRNKVNFGFKLNALNREDYETLNTISYAPIFGLPAELMLAVESALSTNYEMSGGNGTNIAVSQATGAATDILFRKVGGAGGDVVKDLTATMLDEGAANLSESGYKTSIDEQIYIDESVSRGFFLLGFTDENNNFKQERIDELKNNFAEENGLDLNNKKDQRKARRMIYEKLRSIGEVYESIARIQYAEAHKSEREAEERRENLRNKRRVKSNAIRARRRSSPNHQWWNQY